MENTRRGLSSAKMKLPLFLGLLFFISLSATSVAQNIKIAAASKPDRVKTQELEKLSSLSTYIVHLKKPEDGASLLSEDLLSWYHSFLPPNTETLTHQQRMVFSYRNVVSGFAAKLTAEEAKALEEKEEVLSARPETILSLHTTHTPSFLGLQQGLGLWKDANFAKGIIIGILDTGINPRHPSFLDQDMPSPPAKWKGFCEFTGNRTCNNKLIGARNFLKNKRQGGNTDPFDEVGHGTHTASTAAGRFVQGSGIFGNARGTAAGMAPDAHIAIYKVCGVGGCPGSAILAGMDTAVEDGVDVLSLSFGTHSRSFSEEPSAVGAFGAMQKGIFVSCSAGNSGPFNSSLSNEAPWILTVGAGTTDRKIKATAKLGNGAEFVGESVNQPRDFPSTLLPLVYPGANGNRYSVFCASGSLANVDVKGKVVLCEQGGGIPRIDKEQEVKDAGGAAMILMNDELGAFTPFADPHVLPAVHVSNSAGLAIQGYINSTSTPTATIFFQGTVIGNSIAPAVTSFSSRGPSQESPGILKPDIFGPGMNILAAWPVPIDNNAPPFNMISGTSMSCPHLSGIAALLKSSHPDWSPAAIKSAIMTTANTANLGGSPILDERLQPADVFATGAGHVNPVKANDPGLVYDLQPVDYIPYLCGLGYTDRQVAIIVQEKVNCSEIGSISQAQLNYPSFSIQMGSTAQLYTRTLTNVGPAKSTYTWEIDVLFGVGMSVYPSKLTFTEVNQKLTYSVEFIPQSTERGNVTFAQGSLKWVSDKHSVRIPIAVLFQ